MLKKVISLLLICLSLSLGGCIFPSKQDSDASKIQDKLVNMEGYACLANVTHISNDATSVYETKQVYQMDGQYRMEVIKPEHVAGLTTVFNGEKIMQYNAKLDQSHMSELIPNDFRNQLFLGTFVKNYLQSEDVCIEVQSKQAGITTVLEAVIPGGNKHMCMQRVWIDQKTYQPIRMAVLNEEDKETVVIEFLEFTYNPKINESIFSVK